MPDDQISTQQDPAENAGGQDDFLFDPSGEEPAGPEGGYDAVPAQRPGEGAAARQQGGQQKEPSVAEILAKNQALEAKMATLASDRDKLLKFFETTKPRLEQLDKLAGVFGGKQDGGEDLPDIPPDIMAGLNNPDPRVSRAALNRLLGEITGQHIKAYQKKQADESEQKEHEADEARQMVHAGFEFMKRDARLKPFAEFAEPMYGQLQEVMKVNKQVREDHEWLNYVPKDIRAAVYSNYALGTFIVKNGGKISNILGIAGIADKANQRNTDRSGQGNANADGTGKAKTEIEKTWDFASRLETGGLD